MTGKLPIVQQANLKLIQQALNLSDKVLKEVKNFLKQLYSHSSVETFERSKPKIQQITF